MTVRECSEYVHILLKSIDNLVIEFKDQDYTALQIADILIEFDDFTQSKFLVSALQTNDKNTINKVQKAISIVEENKKNTLTLK